MLSFHCLVTVPKSPTFARLDHSPSQLAEKTLDLVQKKHIDHLVIVIQAGVEWAGLGRSLEVIAGDRRLRTSYREFHDSYNCCVLELSCCGENWAREIIQDTKHVTDAYVFVGKPDYLVEFTEEISLESSSIPTIIYVSDDILSYDQFQYLLWNRNNLFDSRQTCEDFPNFEAKQRVWKSLIVVTRSAMNSSTDMMRRKVGYYNHMPPFSWRRFPMTLPGWIKRLNVVISDYWIHLYDSVVVYATALQDIIDQVTKWEDCILN